MSRVEEGREMARGPSIADRDRVPGRVFDLSRLLGLAACPGRMNILLALADEGDREWGAGDAHAAAGYDEPSYGCAQLTLLREGGLVACRSRGRERYYRLTPLGESVAAAA